MKINPGPVAVLTASLVLACFAGTSADDARAALAGCFPSVNGPGGVVEGPLSVDEIEKHSMAEISKCENCPQVPFGFINASWVAMKSKIVEGEGDRIYYFMTNTGSWMALMGREGYALIRNGTVVQIILIQMN